MSRDASATRPLGGSGLRVGHPAVATVCTGVCCADEMQRIAALFDLRISAALRSDLVSARLLPTHAPLPPAEEGR